MNWFSLENYISIMPRFGCDTMGALKEAIRNRITTLEELWKLSPDSAEVIIITFVTQHQGEALRDLRAKLHPEDVLIIACSPYVLNIVESLVPAETLLYVSEDIPIGFLESIGPQFFTLSFQELGTKRDEYWRERREENFTMFQRDNGFLQVGDTVKSLTGNRWNKFNSFPEWNTTSIDGGNFVHNGKGLLVTMSTRNSKTANNIEHRVRESQLLPMFGLVSMVSLPNLGDVFKIPHADMCAVWINETTLGITQFANSPYKRHNKEIMKTVQRFAEECSLQHGQVINIVRIPCLGNALPEDGRGMYAQAVVTSHAIYIPKFGKEMYGVSEEELLKYQEADEKARLAYASAEQSYGSGRPVIQIDSALLSFKSRGSIHCLTTQLKGAAVLQLLNDLKTKAAELEPWDYNCYL